MTPVCPICNKNSVLVNGKKIYPHRPDLYKLNFYACLDHPDYYCGCHKGTTTPLGILANKEHRKLKMDCHAIFDPLWKSKEFGRKDLYKKLSDAMDLPSEETHFGMFTIDQLKKAHSIIKKWNEKHKV